MNEDNLSAILLTEQERMVVGGCLALIFGTIAEGQLLTGKLKEPQKALAIIILAMGPEKYTNLLRRLTPETTLEKF